MKKILITILVLTVINSCKTIKKTNCNRAFESYKAITCIRGYSNQDRANIFKEIYTKYSTDSYFVQALFEFLESDKCMRNYHDIGWFLNKKVGYTGIDNYPLAEKVLLEGLDVCKDLPLEEMPNRCVLLWDLTYLYFSYNKSEKAKEYARIIGKETIIVGSDSIDCIDLVPALSRDESEIFLNFVDNANK